MNTLNDSVIICEMSPKSNKKKTPLGTRKSQRNVKKTFYESPLKHIQLSNKRWKQMQKEQKLMRNIRQINNNKKNSFSLMKDVSLQDSIIILSDNENDSSNQKDQGNYAKPRKRKKSLEILTEDKESSTFLHNSNKCSCERDTERCPKRRRRNSPSLPDNESSCYLISDTEDSDIISIDVDNENIAPASNSINQNADDIIVVWSSKTSGTLSNNNSVDERPINEEENRLFVIDCTPHPENLSYLECDKESTSNECKINTTRSCEKRSKQCSENKTEESEVNNSEESEETSDEDEEPMSLPFSKQGMKLPKAHNISKKLVIKKPQRKNPFINCKRYRIQLSSHTIPVVKPSSFESARLESSRLEPSSLQLSRPKPSRPEPPKPEPSISKPPTKLREIIIDGNNVAMAYKNNKKFSEEGIMLVTNYFQQRGHIVKVFLPHYRRSKFSPLLEKLYEEGIVIFTPSRRIGGRQITPYDDRYILQYATVSEGIIISNDQFRDLYQEKPEWRNTIENRLLAPTFVGDYVMFPEDPLGRNGPNLEEFLRF